MTPYDHSAEENVNDAAIRAGMKSLEGKYPVTVRYEKFERTPYDPEAAVAEYRKIFPKVILGRTPIKTHGYGLSDPIPTKVVGGMLQTDFGDGGDLVRDDEFLRAALTAAHAAGKREAYEKAIEVIDDDCWGEVIRNSIREAARDDGVELS